MNIGLVLPNWIGDVVMATPTIRALREYYGAQANVYGIMRPYVGKVLDGTPWIDQEIFFDRRSSNPEHRLWEVKRKLRELELDTLFYFPHSLRVAWLGFLAGAKNRIGFAKNLRGMLLTHRLRPPRMAGKVFPRSAIEHYLDLAEAVGADTSDPLMELRCTDTDRRGADIVWRNLGLHNARETVFIHSATGSGNARYWRESNFVQLARRLNKERGAAVVFLCGPKETTMASRLATQVALPQVHSMAEQDLGIGVAKACMERASLVISTDSGPRHIATALGTPVVGLCGPIDPKLTYWTHRRSTTVVADNIECAPCNKTKCRLKENICMTRLSVDRVFAAATQQLEREWHRSVA